MAKTKYPVTMPPKYNEEWIQAERRCLDLEQQAADREREIEEAREHNNYVSSPDAVKALAVAITCGAESAGPDLRPRDTAGLSITLRATRQAALSARDQREALRRDLSARIAAERRADLVKLATATLDAAKALDQALEAEKAFRAEQVRDGCAGSYFPITTEAKLDHTFNHDILKNWIQAIPIRYAPLAKQAEGN